MLLSPPEVFLCSLMVVKGEKQREGKKENLSDSKIEVDVREGKNKQERGKLKAGGRIKRVK